MTDSAPMNGADSLLQTLEANDVEVCFGNPGTSEMHFVAALEKTEKIRGVLGLFEGTVTGAADGYGRMTGKPAATLLHLGPGLANGLSNLHNALRAKSPIVNVIGDHASYHRELDAPLTSDIEGTARPFSHWVRTTAGADSLSADTAEAVATAREGKIASLILPADAAWNEVTQGETIIAREHVDRRTVDEDAVARAAEVLTTAGPKTAFVFGEGAVDQGSLEAASRIAALTGATVLTHTFISRLPRGAGRYNVGKLPYAIKLSQPLMEEYDNVVLVGAKIPVGFFAYPGRRSLIAPGGTFFIDLGGPGSDPLGGIRLLAERLGADGTGASAVAKTELQVPDARPTGTITPEKLGYFIAGAIPENAIVLDESLTTGGNFYQTTATAAPHDYLGGTGGSIGWAMPGAVGASVACPDRKVITLESDGSAMYQLQALWTMARENLDVVTLIFANRKYQILRNEMENVGVDNVGKKSGALLDLDNPVIDFVSLARGMGVPSARATTMEELGKAFDNALASEGPALIEVVL